VDRDQGQRHPQPKAVASAVGGLLVQSLEQPVQSLVQTTVQGRPSAPDTAPQSRPRRRFARLFIDDDNWSRLRERAVQHHLPVARLIGLVVEDEARGLGWRPSRDRGQAARPAEEYLLERAALARAHAERQVVDAIARARSEGISWHRIGELVCTSAQAAQQPYGAMVAEQA
jgi:hypothetical protein